MNNWLHFNVIGITCIILWVLGLVLLSLSHFNQHKGTLLAGGVTFSTLAILIFSGFICWMWIRLERPPLRTLGETRLWSTLFLSTMGLITYLRWKNKFSYGISLLIYGFILLVSFVFLIINLAKPEIHEKELMPALQSPWFVPHVIAYILAYTFLAISCVLGFLGLILLRINKYEDKIIEMGDNMVYLGFALLTFGLLVGALWAKIAWGHYWTWDPKETWAFLTWLGYIIYIHYRYFHPQKIKTHLWILALSFIILLICWFGINYLPSAKNSVHVYSN